MSVDDDESYNASIIAHCYSICQVCCMNIVFTSS
jgi:hypothetical protein